MQVPRDAAVPAMAELATRFTVHDLPNATCRKDSPDDSCGLEVSATARQASETE